MTIYTTLYLRGTGRANGAEEIKVSEQLHLNIAVYECVCICVVCCQLLLLHLQAAKTGRMVSQPELLVRST